MGGPIVIGVIGPRHLTFANRTALCASTKPLPVAKSGPAPAGLPVGFKAVPLHLPVVTSRAVVIRILFTCAGVSLGQACLIKAAAPANCGAAAEVPLNAAHPSLLAVSSPFGCAPPAF